jgi:hypothetical protein
LTALSGYFGTQKSPFFLKNALKGLHIGRPAWPTGRFNPFSE